MYVYILSGYPESEGGNVSATLDRTKILDLVEITWPITTKMEFSEQIITEFWGRIRKNLADLLEKTDESLEGGRGHNLTRSQVSGPMLHVIRLR